MAGTNDFVVFDPNSTNIESQATYLTDTARLNGVGSGTASSALANKSWRQGTAMAAMLGQFIANVLNVNVADDGTTATLLSNFEAALEQFLLNQHGNVYFSSSTTWTCPANVTMVYAEAWGGGGGGLGGTGGSAGGGGYAAGWISVTPGTVYTITIGAGGAANAGNGGNTTGLGLTGGGGGAGSAGAGLPGTASGGTINLSGQPGEDIDANGSYFLGAIGMAVGGCSPRGGFGGTVNAANAISSATAPGGGGGAQAQGGAGPGAAGGFSIVW